MLWTSPFSRAFILSCTPLKEQRINLLRSLPNLTRVQLHKFFAPLLYLKRRVPSHLSVELFHNLRSPKDYPYSKPLFFFTGPPRHNPRVVVVSFFWISFLPWNSSFQFLVGLSLLGLKIPPISSNLAPLLPISFSSRIEKHSNFPWTD